MAGRSHFAAPVLLVAVVGLILYVSLYPFRFAADGDWLHIEQARSACWLRNNELAQEIEYCAAMIDQEPDHAVVEYFNTRIRAPLGLDPAKTA